MKKLFDDLLIYENILLSYYSGEQTLLKSMLNDNFEVVINRFLEILTYEDTQKGTDHVNLVKEIYSNPQFDNRTAYYRQLHLSNSTLQRYREKYCTTLKLVVEWLNGD